MTDISHLQKLYAKGFDHLFFAKKTGTDCPLLKRGLPL